ncbi:BgTH12-03204 [Blumeria graminis f. sp. triticale]|uniref:Bgt-55024 n=3 Tax=Blumeria graminis TaxID=34373 RepID=A0A9X9MK90_BLUGR|nr:BgTH12-03203 [Blumeria graminis f. sp. triticale]CAD6503542.1 BgTH12-03204 [Blumeria graminis f. sp. triticale]VDB89675.1 BgtE-20071 [Blumeria graminis f. sp. tritici]VDB89676.1 Bgt-55024 [Blumeria graminis f. sp. tritici]VDB89679.1 Bgt-55025 [Blumeria graminis f. sp. tritici]
MQRIHSLLIAGLFFIVFAIANERTFQCGTKVKFEDILINEKLNEMKSYYKSSFRACRFKKLCIRRRLRKLIWRRRNYTGSSDNANLPDSMALWLPIRKSGENRSGLLRRKSNTYQVVATCTKRTSCELLRVTERSRGKKSIETACPEIRSQNIVRPSFSKLFTFKQAPEGAS